MIIIPEYNRILIFPDNGFFIPSVHLINKFLNDDISRLQGIVCTYHLIYNTQISFVRSIIIYKFLSVFTLRKLWFQNDLPHWRSAVANAILV